MLFQRQCAVQSNEVHRTAMHCCASANVRGFTVFGVVDLQETWSKTGTAVTQHKLGELAVKCLQRAGQEEKPPVCRLLKQECEVYHTLHALDASHTHQLQSCLQKYNSVC